MRAMPFLCTHRILGEIALTQSARGRIHENSQSRVERPDPFQGASIDSN